MQVPVTLERGGVDPEIAEFVQALAANAARHPDLTTRSFPEQRATLENGRARWRTGGPAVRRREDLRLQVGSKTIRVRLLDAGSGAAPDRAALIYLHGGGFTYFSLETHDRLMREYAARTGAIVFGVDYSLSPEVRFPCALHETVAVIDWLHQNAVTLGVDSERVAIGGDSAGASLALAACLMLRDRGDHDRIAAMLLNYGFFDTDLSTASQRKYGDAGALLTREELTTYISNYIRDDTDRSNPLAFPALAQFHDLPPSLHVLAECDPLVDADRLVASRLGDAGNRVTARVYRGATHSFLEAVSIAKLADQALADSANWLRATLAIRELVA